MRKAYILLIIGIWVAVLPYLGFPYSWKDILFTLTGLGLIYFSYILYKDYRIEDKETIFDNFSENNDFNENKAETIIKEKPEPIKLNQEEI